MDRKRVISRALLGVGAAIGLLAIVVATRPSTFHVERSVTIAAPAENAFSEVNDFHSWTKWSPYEKLDPQMKRTFEGAQAGAGASYAWKSDGRAGAGRMTIDQSEKASRVVIKLEFLEPMEMTNTATFTFVPTAEGTRVTWAMDGKNNFFGKAASLVFDMDKVVGADFEQGLAALKAVAEGAPKATAEASSSH
jgi:uncharacterized protein YndB with AHSA1/START domain